MYSCTRQCVLYNYLVNSTNRWPLLETGQCTPIWRFVVPWTTLLILYCFCSSGISSLVANTSRTTKHNNSVLFIISNYAWLHVISCSGVLLSSYPLCTLQHWLSRNTQASGVRRARTWHRVKFWWSTRRDAEFRVVYQFHPAFLDNADLYFFWFINLVEFYLIAWYLFWFLVHSVLPTRPLVLRWN